jgi:hypothetical protein
MKGLSTKLTVETSPHDARVSIVLVVVVFENHRIGFVLIRERGLCHGCAQRRATFVRQRVHGVTAVTNYQKRSLAFALRTGKGDTCGAWPERNA